MVLLEKIIDEIKQLSPIDQRLLFKILQKGTKSNRPNKIHPASQTRASSPDTIDLDLVEPELKWLMENGWILEKFRDEYIALKGEELIAHGTLREVLKESKRRGINRPFTQYIPKTEKEWLLGQGNYPITDA